MVPEDLHQPQKQKQYPYLALSPQLILCLHSWTRKHSTMQSRFDTSESQRRSIIVHVLVLLCWISRRTTVYVSRHFPLTDKNGIGLYG